MNDNFFNSSEELMMIDKQEVKFEELDALSCGNIQNNNQHLLGSS